VALGDGAPEHGGVELGVPGKVVGRRRPDPLERLRMGPPEVRVVAQVHLHRAAAGLVARERAVIVPREGAHEIVPRSRAAAAWAGSPSASASVATSSAMAAAPARSISWIVNDRRKC